ncbi:uncharacterized protein TNCV_4963641 [Trichonephila clavipes]|nr:uncharacterized protein TNCV_4963641 [Trichonephila clavipes]
MTRIPHHTNQFAHRQQYGRWNWRSDQSQHTRIPYITGSRYNVYSPRLPSLFYHHPSFSLQRPTMYPRNQRLLQRPAVLRPDAPTFYPPREPDKANSYEHVKDLLLKRFKLTPEKFRQLFVTHQKAPERTWIDFYHELNTYFNGWIDGLKIDTFKKLSDLIITDQLKRKTPFEFKEYYLDEWANMNSPVQLAEKLEEFEDFKRTLKQKSSSPFVKKQEFRFTEKNHRYEAPGKFEYNRKDKKFPASTNYNKHYEAPVTKYESVQRYQDSAQKGYYNKNYEKHSNHNASKHMLRRTIQNCRNSKNLQKKLAHSSLRKVYVLKRYFLER